MKQIWKYNLSDSNAHLVPEGGIVRRVAYQQRYNLMVWVEIDPGAPHELWKFFLRGTGVPFEYSRDIEFIGSVEAPSELIWHVYVKKEQRNG